MLRTIVILLVSFDAAAIVPILKSSDDGGSKLLWIAFVILLPFIGMILYFAMGPGRRSVI